jgi:hypothetical protein
LNDGKPFAADYTGFQAAARRNCFMGGRAKERVFTYLATEVAPIVLSRVAQ